MLTHAGRIARRWIADAQPWTNVYGLARTIIASATALTLIFNQSSNLFRPASGIEGSPPFCTGVKAIGLFCLEPRSHLEPARWVAIAALLLVASGWRPRFTGVLHWWVSFSLFSSAIVVDGGDQTAAVLSFLLIPVTLTDPRRWHWDPMPTGQSDASKLVAKTWLSLVRLQVAGIYLHAAAGKFAVEEWADGTALYYWLLHPSLGAPDWLAPSLQRLLLIGPFVSLLTWSIVVLEFFLAAGLLAPKSTQKWLLACGITLHLGIIVLHGLVSFGSTMVAALILFLRPTEITFEVPRVLRLFRMRRVSSISPRGSVTPAPNAWRVAAR